MVESTCIVPDLYAYLFISIYKSQSCVGRRRGRAVDGSTLEKCHT